MAFDKEQVTVLLKDVMDRIKTEEDPVELNELRKLFRKYVPFTLRSYAAAYLIKQLVGETGRSGRQGRYKDRPARANPRRTSARENGGASPELEERPHSSRRESFRVSLPEDLSTTIFISIGRNRRVFPRDLVSLISQSAGIDRDRIGDIRVLDNYSFVQLLTEDAQTAISRLDGYDYRGRKLSVSYSRKKDDSAVSENAGSDSMMDYAAHDGEIEDSLSDDDMDSLDSSLDDTLSDDEGLNQREEHEESVSG